MAFEPNPEVIVSGAVVRSQERAFDGTPKGRTVQIRTRTGFAEVRIPLALADVEAREDSHVAWVVDMNHWSMPDDKNPGHTKTGLALTLTRALDELELTGLLAAVTVAPGK